MAQSVERRTGDQMGRKAPNETKKTKPSCGSHVLYIGLYREKHKKNLLVL